MIFPFGYFMMLAKIEADEAYEKAERKARKMAEQRERATLKNPIAVAYPIHSQTEREMAQKRLSQAIENCDLKAVRRCLEDPNVDLDLEIFIGKYGVALSLAYQKGYIDIVKEILKSPKLSYIGFSDFLDIVDLNQTDIIDLALNHPHISPNFCYQMFLIRVVENQNMDIIKKLVKNPKYNINATNHLGETALIIACARGDLDAVRELLKSPNIDVNHSRYGSETALMIACKEGNLEIVKELLKAPKIDVNKGNSGKTALLCAFLSKNTEVVKTVLEAGAKIGHVWEVSTSYVDFEIINLLIETAKKEEDFDFNQVLIENCKMVLDRRVLDERKKGYLEVVKQLSKVPEINPNIPILVDACRSGNTELVDVLLSIPGINVNIKECGSDYTSLMYACENGHVEIARKLLQFEEIDIDQKDSRGLTAVGLSKNKQIRALFVERYNRQFAKKQNQTGTNIKACEMPEKKKEG